MFLGLVKAKPLAPINQHIGQIFTAVEYTESRAGGEEGAMEK
jgi:hypothetical protein